jgi:transposase-like protein
MDLKEVVRNYLTANDEGMKHLITWFLNEVMQEEADQQAGARRYRRTSSKKDAQDTAWRVNPQ